MKFGLAQDDYNFIKKHIQEKLGTDIKIWCFGSRARGDQRKFSDLDLIIDGPDELRQKIGELDELFEESNLPIKVDIVLDGDFAESYRESYIKDRVEF